MDTDFRSGSGLALVLHPLNDSPDQAPLSAVEQYRSARLHAEIERVKAAFTGKSAGLLSYEEVPQKTMLGRPTSA